jgi:hypothetical protein
MRIHYLADKTVIADVYKRPLHKTRVHTEPRQTWTVRELEGLGNFRFAISQEPVDRSQIQLVVNHPSPTPSGGKRQGVVVVKTLAAQYQEDGKGPHVRVDLPALAARLKKDGVKRTWEAALWLEYAVPDEG